MKKRIAAGVLWFYSGWYAGVLLADMIGVSPLIGPLLGVVLAGLIVGDPRRIIWKRQPTTAAASNSAPSSVVTT